MLLVSWGPPSVGSTVETHVVMMPVPVNSSAWAVKSWRLIVLLAVVASLNLLSSRTAEAVDVNASVVAINGTNKAVLYTPASNSNSHIAILVMHPFLAYSAFPACSELASRGFTMLCADSVFSHRRFDYKGYEDHAPAVAAGIGFLREQPGVTRVLIMGHGMGGPMMSFYDWVQENGVAACQDPRRFIPCDTTNLLDVNGNPALPPADGLILFDTHLGDAFATFTNVDPAIGDPDDPGRRNAAVDMFAAENGYVGDAAAGSPSFKSSNYGNGFRDRFFNAQASRNANAARDAQRILAEIQAGNPRVYSDDMFFEEPGAADAAEMWQADLNLLKCSQRPHLLLARNGTAKLSSEPICSVRVPSASFARANSFASDIHASVRVWLGAHALRANGPYRQTSNDVVGLDHASSNTSAVVHAQGVRKPVLILANSGSYFVRLDEIIFDNLKSADKTYAVAEGAAHDGAACKACEKALGLPAGYFGDTQARTYNFMAAWLSARF